MTAERCCEHSQGRHYCAEPHACSLCECKAYYSLNHEIEKLLARIWPVLHRECSCETNDECCAYRTLADATHELEEMFQKYGRRRELRGWAAATTQ